MLMDEKSALYAKIKMLEDINAQISSKLETMTRKVEQLEKDKQTLIEQRDTAYECHDKATEVVLLRGQARDAALKEIERLKAQVEKEHEVAGELQEGLSKQYREFAAEADALEAKLKASNLQNQEMRRDFESIVLRCTEGDKKSDWLPVISGIARKWIERRVELSGNSGQLLAPDGSTPPSPNFTTSDISTGKYFDRKDIKIVKDGIVVGTEKRVCECVPGVHKFCPEHGYPAMRPLEGPGSANE